MVPARSVRGVNIRSGLADGPGCTCQSPAELPSTLTNTRRVGIAIATGGGGLAEGCCWVAVGRLAGLPIAALFPQAADARISKRAARRLLCCTFDPVFESCETSVWRPIRRSTP